MGRAADIARPKCACQLAYSIVLGFFFEHKEGARTSPPLRDGFIFNLSKYRRLMNYENDS